MPQPDYTRHGLTTYKKYKGMEVWGWGVPRLIVRYEVIMIQRGQPNQLQYARMV